MATPTLKEVSAGALKAGYDAMETYLLGVGTQYQKKEIPESTYTCADATITDYMQALSDKHEVLTGEPLGVFQTS